MKVSQGDAPMENKPAEHKVSLEQLKGMLLESGFMELVKKKKDGVPLCSHAMLEAGGRAGSEDLRTGALPLLTTSCGCWGEQALHFPEAAQQSQPHW